MANISSKVAPKEDKTVEVTPVTAKHTIVVKGDTYKIKLRPAKTEGFPLLEEILKTVGPSIGSVLDGLSGVKYSDNVVFTTAFLQLSEKLDRSFLQTIDDTLLAECTVNGKPLPEDHWDGNYGAWKTLLAFAFKENFSSFFENGWMQGLAELKAMIPVE